jgi:hypothetical protein
MTKKSEVKKTEEKSTEKVSKKTIQKENKILSWVIAIILIVFLLIMGIFFTSKAVRFSKYNDILEFETVQEGDLIFYKTTLSVQEGKVLQPYNLYLRTKPKDLEKVPFEESDNFELMKFSAINPEEGFICEGDGTIAIANLASLYKIIGGEFYVDENSTCDGTGRYTYFDLKHSNNTRIIKTGDNCYDVEVKDCEIIPATEKIMVEILLKMN